MQNKRKFTAILLVFALLGTMLFQVLHADHDCNHCEEENCPVCLVLNRLNNTKKFTIHIVSTLAEFLSFVLIDIFIFSAMLFVFSTPVSQKIKLLS